MATKKTPAKKTTKKAPAKKAKKAPARKASPRFSSASIRVLKQTLLSLARQHDDLLEVTGEAVVVKSRGEVYPVKTGNKIDWFQQVEAVETRGERHAYTGVVLQVARPVDAVKRCRILKEAKRQVERAEDLDRGQKALSKVRVSFR